MSLFNAIFESVLNEIKSDDAYARFYSSMPREDFDRITGGAPDIDKFVQFLLNSVRDGTSTVEEAAQANEEYKSADPLIRQNILNAFRNGEYETAKEVLINIQYLKEGGFINKNKFAKEGYIKVAEDDEWLVTCTTNYMANNHYFGHTKWCTASDRMGRYDGYLMYRRYGENGNSLLMQFTRKNTKGETYQAEVDNVIDGNPTVSTICNIEDEQLTLDRLKSIVGAGLVNEVLNDIDKLQKLIKIQKDQKVHEDKYQDKQSKIIAEKRRREEERLNRLREEVNDEVERRNAPLKEELKRVWQDAVSNKLYENIDFLNKLLDYRERIEETYQTDFENTIQETHGLIITDRSRFCYDGHQYRLMSIELGTVSKPWFVKDVYNDDDVVVSYEPAKDEEYFDMSAKMFILVECLNEKATRYITSLEHGEGYTYSPWTIQTRMSAYNERFLVDFFHFTNDEGNQVTKSYLFDIKTHNAICYDKDLDLDWPDDYAPKRLFPLDDGTIILTSYQRNWKHPFSVLTLKSDGSFDFCCDSDKNARFTIDEDRCVLYDSNSRMLVRTDYTEPRIAKVPGGEKVASIYRAMDTNRSVVYIYSEDKANMLDMETGEFIFGMWCEDCSQNYDEDVFNGVFISKQNERINIEYNKPDNKYRIKSINRKRCDIPCDKYGENEEQRKKRELGDKNYKAWLAAGGHSPEAKAQMDAMWADRDAKNNDGSEAMAAWNDSDIRPNAPEDAYCYGPFFSRIDSHEDDKNWLKNRWGDNMVGLRDPEDFFKTYDTGDWDNPSAYRPGQTYRIGKNGKPLDQPWRDEDEIPARFTDDSLNESVKKVITLMNKLIKD